MARKFVLAAIESGASVVTANKALLAKYGPEIYAAAEAKGVDIYFEASVGGAIPFLKPLRESLVGDKVTSMLGIVNGTTNYILDEMTTKGLDFDDVLKDAQAKGYAEADPTGDIEGYDAANKAAIMATLGFHTNVTIDDVSVEALPRSPPTILLPQPPKQGHQAAGRGGEWRGRRVCPRVSGADFQRASAGFRAWFL